MSEPRPTVSRRCVLKMGGSATLLPLGFILSGPGPIQRACAEIRAFEFKTLDHARAMLLLSVERTLFPYDFLADAQYMKIVVALDDKAAGDKDLATMVKAALAAFPDDFTARTEVKREEYLRGLEGSPFFRLVYQETITGIYGDPAVSILLGDEGSSVEHGGYLNRGFDDIGWLPADKQASK
jgi:hypothetical protein